MPRGPGAMVGWWPRPVASVTHRERQRGWGRQQHRVDHAEHRGVRPNPQSEGQNRDGREARPAPEGPQGAAQFEVSAGQRALIVAFMQLNRIAMPTIDIGMRFADE